MPRSPTGPRAAYIEDYNEDAKTTLPETRQTANIAAKRSKPDIVKDVTVAPVHDEFSDSGYSSKTGATLGSGDSSLDSKTGPPALRINTDAAISRGRFGAVHQDQHHAAQSLRKPILRRTDSRAKDRGPKPHQECQCDECRIKEHLTARSPEKSRSARVVAAQTTSRAPPPAAVPPRPQSTRPVAPPPMQEVPTAEPTQARPRVITSQSYRKQRPTSFHGGSFPPQITYQPVYLAQAQPTVTAQSPLLAPSYPPPSHSYFTAATPVQHNPYPYPTTPSPLEQRPLPRLWNPGQPTPQRQPIIYSAAPVIEHVHQSPYSTTVQPLPTIRRAPIQRGYTHPPREEQYSCDEDYYRMPPPSLPSKQQTQRPTIRHAATTSVAHAALSQRRSSRGDTNQDSHPPLPSPVKAAVPVRETFQRPVVATRPSASSNNSGSSTNTLERDMRRMSIESNSAAAKNRRPLSYYGHESSRDLERSVEAYQASNGSGVEASLTTDSLNLVRKKTHPSSDTGSRISGQSRGSKRSSEGKARSSTDRRPGSDVKARSETDGLTMRFNASQAVNVDFKGSSVDGRTISLRPSKDGGGGDMVLGIGGKSSATSSRPLLKQKSRKRYSFVESSGVRELETASGAGRLTRESKTRESSRAPEKRIAVSRSRRSSRSGRN
ncbi:MAG: hypothetical protein Q9195_003655 [Heterodermia aff. obscurata]